MWDDEATGAVIWIRGRIFKMLNKCIVHCFCIPKLANSLKLLCDILISSWTVWQQRGPQHRDPGDAAAVLKALFLLSRTRSDWLLLACTIYLTSLSSHSAVTACVRDVHILCVCVCVSQFYPCSKAVEPVILLLTRLVIFHANTNIDEMYFLINAFFVYYSAAYPFPFCIVSMCLCVCGCLHACMSDDYAFVCACVWMCLFVCLSCVCAHAGR